ncbi:MAG TPA: M14 family metallopeptidase [Isosphaeraceae bacterium]
MRRTLGLALPLILGAALAEPAAPARGDLPRTRAETSDYVETSRYDDVTAFIAALQRASPLLRVEVFGRSHVGRDLPLLILADPPVSSPREATASGKPVVFIMANIHAGEVEGKESALHLARRVVAGDGRPLLDKMILLIAPIYNADGNEAIRPENRREQNGPIAGVGARENAQGLDLNRDYIKAESPEARALIRLFNRWDPHLTVDLHTTNGSHHGYHLTYSIPLNPSGDQRIIAYLREKMMPAVARGMAERHGFRSYYYGNFSDDEPAPGLPGVRSWRAFTHQPRIGQNYVGLRNRLAILSEAYSYLDFRGRVAVTSAFVDEILAYVAARGPELVALCREADADAARLGAPRPLGVAYKMIPLPDPVEILVGEVTKRTNPRTGFAMTAMVEDKFTPERMLDYGAFAATRTVAVPSAYLFRDEPGLRPVRDLLLLHGIAVEALTGPAELEVESFAIGSVRRNERTFQGHREVKLTGRAEAGRVAFPAGTYLVRSAQPLAVLAAYLLDPESDDGVVTWNLVDAYLAPGKAAPIYRLTKAVDLPARLVGQD